MAEEAQFPHVLETPLFFRSFITILPAESMPLMDGVTHRKNEKHNSSCLMGKTIASGSEVTWLWVGASVPQYAAGAQKQKEPEEGHRLPVNVVKEDKRPFRAFIRCFNPMLAIRRREQWGLSVSEDNLWTRVLRDCWAFNVILSSLTIRRKKKSL